MIVVLFSIFSIISSTTEEDCDIQDLDYVLDEVTELYVTSNQGIKFNRF